MEKLSLINTIQISSASVVPKYIQLANAINKAITSNVLQAGSILPTINELSSGIGLARDTVEKGYKVLKERKIILSKKGLGYFVAEGQVYDMRIAVFLNKLSYHKKLVYDAFIAELKGRAEVDLFVYNSDVDYLQHIINSQYKAYDYYVVFPHFVGCVDRAAEVLSRLPQEKVLLLGKQMESLQHSFASIYENYESDIYAALHKSLGAIRKYQYLKLVFPEQGDYPKSIIKGFYKFCQDFAFNFSLVEDLESESVLKEVCYVVLTDEDLVHLLDLTKENGYALGTDVGVISYNETPLKRHMYDGITTISTDFVLMGKMAAECIKNRKGTRTAVPFYAHIRASI